MKSTFHMELIILILAFSWLPYAIYNTVTSCLLDYLTVYMCFSRGLSFLSCEADKAGI